MSEDITVALIAMVGAVLVAVITAIPVVWALVAKARAARAARDAEMAALRVQVEKVLTATTVNHHASDPPTLVDRLDNVQSSIAGLTATVDAHHDEQQRRNDQQDERLGRGMMRFGRIESAIKRNHPGEAL